MSLVSLNIGQYGFNYVPGWGPDSGWLATWGELDFTPDTDATYRHYWALQRISPFLMDEGTAGIDVTTSLPLAVSGHPVRIADSREFLHQSAMYKLSPIFREGDLLPYIVTHPSDATTVDYQMDAFTVEALGADTYQWQRDGTDIAGATEATYWTTGFEVSGDYRVHVCNYEGCIYSDSAHLHAIRTLVTPYCLLSNSTLSISDIVFDSDQTAVPIHGNGIVWLLGDISSTGPTINIFSTVKITTDVNLVLRANLTAPEIKLGSGTVVIGTQTGVAVPAVSIPSIDWTGYRDYATANGEYYADSTTISTDYTSVGSLSYFDTSSYFDGTATYAGAIISDDTIQLTDQRRIVSTGIAVAANGISSSSSKDCTGILYSTSTISLAGNSKVSGQIISAGAMIIASPNIFYRPL